MRWFAFVLLLLALPLTTPATVIDLEEMKAKDVIEVYEQQQEAESPDQGWIHSFEEDSLGDEMDHLSRVKPRADEDMRE